MLHFDLKKPCDTCPFVKTNKTVGRADWFEDVLGGYMRESLEHTCHKTDPLADFYVGGDRKQHCVGILGMMKKQNDIISPSARKAIEDGRLDWKKISTVNIYSLKELIGHYKIVFKLDRARGEL